MIAGVSGTAVVTIELVIAHPAFGDMVTLPAVDISLVMETRLDPASKLAIPRSVEHQRGRSDSMEEA